MPREPTLRVICPVCGDRLSITSLPKHVGMTKCMETKYPQLKVFRLQAARQAKLEYDRRFSKARRDALREVSIQFAVGQGAVAAVTAVVEPVMAPLNPVEPALPLRIRRQRPPPQIIDLSGEDDEDEAECAICLEVPFRPVRPRSCVHAMCSECASLHVGHSLDQGHAVICPSCRTPLVM